VTVLIGDITKADREVEATDKEGPGNPEQAEVESVQQP
jgi:hypothetical protein